MVVIRRVPTKKEVRMEQERAMRAQKEFMRRKMDSRDDFGEYIDDTIILCTYLLRARQKRRSYDPTFFNISIGVILQIIVNSVPENFHSSFRGARMLRGDITEDSLSKFLCQVKGVRDRMSDMEREARKKVHKELNANLQNRRIMRLSPLERVVVGACLSERAIVGGRE